MTRSPLEIQREKYLKSIRIKKIIPKIFWKQCVCCGKEYKKEPVYSCTYNESIYGMIFEIITTKYGCSHCFHTEQEFKDYLFEYDYLDKFYLQLPKIFERKNSNDD